MSDGLRSAGCLPHCTHTMRSGLPQEPIGGRKAENRPEPPRPPPCIRPSLACTNSRRTYSRRTFRKKENHEHVHVHGIYMGTAGTATDEVKVMPPFIGRGVPRSTEGYCGWIGSGSEWDPRLIPAATIGLIKRGPHQSSGNGPEAPGSEAPGPYGAARKEREKRRKEGKGREESVRAFARFARKKVLDLEGQQARLHPAAQDSYTGQRAHIGKTSHNLAQVLHAACPPVMPCKKRALRCTVP